MYVCICHGVTDRALAQAVAGGARSVPELAQCLGVGTGCGRCLEEVCARLETAVPRTHPAEPTFALALS